MSVLFPAQASSPSSRARHQLILTYIDPALAVPGHSLCQKGCPLLLPLSSAPLPTPGPAQCLAQGRLTQPRNAPGWVWRSSWSSSLWVTRMETPAAAWSINTRHTVEKQKSIFRLFPAFRGRAVPGGPGWWSAGASVPHWPSPASTVILQLPVSASPPAGGKRGQPVEPCLGMAGLLAGGTLVLSLQQVTYLVVPWGLRVKGCHHAPTKARVSVETHHSQPLLLACGRRSGVGTWSFSLFQTTAPSS